PGCMPCPTPLEFSASRRPIETRFRRHRLMALKIYSYEKCGTCRKALRFLDDHNVAYQVVPLREVPPTKAELRNMLEYVGGDVRKLFNTAGRDYRELNLKDKLPAMTEEEALELLAANGNLVKRPFILDNAAGTVGYDSTLFQERYT